MALLRVIELLETAERVQDVLCRTTIERAGLRRKVVAAALADARARGSRPAGAAMSRDGVFAPGWSPAPAIG